MRYIHSCGVVHRDLKPGNILLDWDWNVRIADFGHSVSRKFPDSLSMNGEGLWALMPSVDWRYLAPECYDNQYSPRSDVFAVGLILFELIVGHPAFPKHLRRTAIAKLVIVDEFRPEIPEWVLPEVKKLMTDCWSDDPDDRPSFRIIFKRLKDIDFKVTAAVNSGKLSKFVKEIKTLEACAK
jgi:serine/threonine protein kinase